MGLGCVLQRLFSSFPDGSPGFGLLLLRLGAGIALIHSGAAGFFVENPLPSAIAQSAIAVATGGFLVAGLWTPVLSALAALDQIWIVLSLQSSARDGDWIYVLLAVVCASLAMVGPGAWSVDARLFGRRRVYRDRNRGSRTSP